LAGTVVRVNDQPIPLLYVSDCQINAVVPFGAEAGWSGIQIETPYGLTKRSRVELISANPGLFVVERPRELYTSSPVLGRVAALNQDGTLNSPENPASRGSVVVLFMTGLGRLEPSPKDGSIIPTSPPFPRLASDSLQAFIATTDGASGMEILYAGAAPGVVAGLIQMNVRIPSAASTGERVPLRVLVDGPPGLELTQRNVGLSVR